MPGLLPGLLEIAGGLVGNFAEAKVMPERSSVDDTVCLEAPGEPAVELDPLVGGHRLVCHRPHLVMGKGISAGGGRDHSRLDEIVDSVEDPRAWHSAYLGQSIDIHAGAAGGEGPGRLARFTGQPIDSGADDLEDGA